MFVFLQIKTFLWFWYCCVIYEVSLWSNKVSKAKPTSYWAADAF